jgi:ribosome biogenesis protein Nip4
VGKKPYEARLPPKGAKRQYKDASDGTAKRPPKSTSRSFKDTSEGTARRPSKGTSRQVRDTSDVKAKRAPKETKRLFKDDIEVKAKAIDREGEDQGEGEEIPERESHWIEFANKEQKDIVHEELNQYGNGDEPWQNLVVKGDNNVLLFTKGANTSIYLMPREAKDRFKVLMGNPGLRHFGLFLGNFKGTQFNLSMEGMSELAKTGGISSNWVKLNEDGEKSFLYGQSIKKEDLQAVSPRGITHDRGICAVLNALGECLGIGKLEADDHMLRRVSDTDVIIAHVVDKGMYLRNQDKA